jgi:hypothetical protein
MPLGKLKAQTNDGCKIMLFLSTDQTPWKLIPISLFLQLIVEELYDAWSTAPFPVMRDTVSTASVIFLRHF